MKTKLVYVLTSSPENNYIEQALLSVYTARYHNPDATIVLIVDDLTDKLLLGTRKELLEYISEKIVKIFPEEMSMMQRSRWLKTSVRNIIDGDFLFIDCDTLIARSLLEIDTIPYELSAVLDSHLPISKYHKSIYNHIEKNAKILDWDIAKEIFYFNSGVMYVKDTKKNRMFFEKWHSYWFEGTQKGVFIDQPSFAKTNIELGHPIQRLNDIWNCVMYTHPLFDKASNILHFSSYKNMSYVFCDNFLNKVKNEGVKGNDFVQYSILHPTSTYLVFDNIIFNFRLKDYFLMIKTIRQTAKLLAKHVDISFDDYVVSTGIDKYIKYLFRKHLFFIGAFCLTLYKYFMVKINKNYKYVSNTCSADNI